MRAQLHRRSPRLRGTRLRHEEGQGLVEFAIVLPVLLIVLTGMLQFGLMLNKYITLTDAVRSGARNLSLGRGLTDPCTPAVDATINSAAVGGLTLAPNQVTATLLAPDTCSPGNMVEGDSVKISAGFSYTLSVFGMKITTVPLSASATDAIE